MPNSTTRYTPILLSLILPFFKIVFLILLIFWQRSPIPMGTNIWTLHPYLYSISQQHPQTCSLNSRRYYWETETERDTDRERQTGRQTQCFELNDWCCKARHKIVRPFCVPCILQSLALNLLPWLHDVWYFAIFHPRLTGRSKRLNCPFSAMDFGANLTVAWSGDGHAEKYQLDMAPENGEQVAGQVKVFFKQTFGAICNSDWSDTDASVVRAG